MKCGVVWRRLEPEIQRGRWEEVGGRTGKGSAWEMYANTRIKRKAMSEG